MLRPEHTGLTNWEDYFADKDWTADHPAWKKTVIACYVKLNGDIWLLVEYDKETDTGFGFKSVHHGLIQKLEDIDLRELDREEAGLAYTDKNLSHTLRQAYKEWQDER